MSDIYYKLGKPKSHITSHDPQEKYLISLQLMKMFLGLVLKITKNQRILRWKREAVLKDFIEKNV